MQALHLEAQYGLRWIVGGWRLLRKQPVGFIALLFLFWLLLLAASVAIGFAAQGLGALLPSMSSEAIAATGSLLFAALTPALTVGFLQACRLAASGVRIHPILLFAPFGAGRTIVLRLLGLGLIQVLALVAILFVLNGGDVFADDPPAPITPPVAADATTGSNTGDATDAASSTASPTAAATASSTAAAATASTAAADDEATRRRATELAEQGIAYLPIALLMWYAPMLVAWHGVPVGKSLFFSLVGVWRNRVAFLVYGVAWIVIWMTASIAIALVGLAVGVGNVAAIVVAPLAMLLLTCMYCSMYESYATVYVESSTGEVVDA